GAGRGEGAAPLLLAIAEDCGREPSVARRAAEKGIEALPAAHPLFPRLAIAASAALLRQGKRPDARGFATRAWSALAPGLGEAPVPSAEEVADLLDRSEPPEALLLSEAWSLHARTLLESEEETKLIALLEPVLAHGPLAREPEKHDKLVHQIRQSLGLALSNSGRAEEALPHLEATLEAADRRGDPIGRGYDLTAMAQALGNLGRIEEADNAVIEAQAIGDRFGVVPLSLTAAFSHGEAACKLGRLDEAERIFGELADRAGAWNHIEVHIFAQQRLAKFAALRGKPDEAIAHFDRVLPVVRDLGHVNGLLITLTARANTLERWRRLPDAIADLEEALGIAREAGRIPAVAWIQVNLATDHMRAGDASRSREFLEEADETLGTIENDHHRLHMLRCWSNLELYLRRWDAAEERIEAGLALDPDDPELLVKKIRLACGRGESEQARELFDAKRGAITRLPDPQLRKVAEVVEADVLLCEGRAAEATATIHAVLELRADAPPDHVSSAAWLIAARAALKRGHLATAGHAAEEALEAMAVVSSTDRVEASFLLAEIEATQGDEAAIERVESTAEAIGDSTEEAELRARADAAKTRVHEALGGAGAAPSTAASTGIELSLLAILEEIVAGDQLEGLLPRLLDLTLELLDGERGILFLVDPPTGTLAPAVRRGIDADSARDAETWSAGVLERSRGGELVLRDDAHSAEDLREFQSIARFGIRSVAAVPLLEGEISVGAVYVDNRRKPLVISDVSRSAFESLARIFARLIRRTASIEELRGEADRLRTETSIAHDAEQRVENRERWGDLVGASPPMLSLYGRLESLLAAAERMGRLPNTLITGDTGTGKDLVAKELATRCARKDQPYVRVSSADIAPTMIESALFGHRRGSFTGATHDHAGFFEQASGGVLFLDEIGDATPEVQGKLLRAIDNGEIQRLGDDKVREVDVWLITATNCDLQADVEAGKFREDLLYRVREIEVHLPPLRDRIGDVERLATHFLSQGTRDDMPCRLTRGARAALESYDWPGNVRDLRAKITEGIIEAKEGIIGIEQLHPMIQRAAAAAQIAETEKEPEKVAPIEDQIASFIRASLARALREHGGNRTRAAESLGLSERKLRSWIARYAVPTPPSTRGRPPGS
ncbi:MAG: hypothetical protein CL908_23465, partial [Deltaproteobacteria bacterium]|nr:hypothetical protein [Deltaproteobacteria bacterium]